MLRTHQNSGPFNGVYGHLFLSKKSHLQIFPSDVLFSSCRFLSLQYIWIAYVNSMVYVYSLKDKLQLGPMKIADGWAQLALWIIHSNFGWLDLCRHEMNIVWGLLARREMWNRMIFACRLLGSKFYPILIYQSQAFIFQFDRVFAMRNLSLVSSLEPWVSLMSMFNFCPPT